MPKECRLTDLTIFVCECGHTFPMRIMKNSNTMSTGWIIKTDCPTCGKVEPPSEGKHTVQEVDTGKFYDIIVTRHLMYEGDHYYSSHAMGAATRYNLQAKKEE